MADSEQLSVLKDGPGAWNSWWFDHHRVPINLSNADLSGNDLTEAVLMGADLSRANLSGANLGKGVLYMANLGGANLSGANLSGAILYEAILTGANLSEANLTGASLFRADLSGANLRGANVTGTNLSGANLSGADLNGVILNGASLTGAIVRGGELGNVDLSNALGIESIVHQRSPASIPDESSEVLMATNATNGYPVRFDDAFQSMDWQAVLSQAASLLLLGQGLRGGLSFSAEPGDGIIPEEDLDALNLPRLPYFLRRIDREQVLQSLEDVYGRAFVEQMQSAPSLDAQSVLPVASEIAYRLSRSPEPLLVAQLMEVNLFHPEPLVRAAAALSYFDLSSQPRKPFEVLLDATYTDHSLTRQVALAGLERLMPGHPRLLDADTEGVFSEEGLASTTCILMHGSWSRGAPWWQPGGNFHDYFCRDVRSDLYDAEDRFSWSGGLGDGYRVFGAQELRDWAFARNLDGLDIFAHSHGGNIAMFATQFGLKLGKLVLLSCPVFRYARYKPEFKNLGAVVSIRVHLDLVILAARAGHGFWASRIREHTLPVWFDHGATIDPKVWRKHNIPSMI